MGLEKRFQYCNLIPTNSFLLPPNSTAQVRGVGHGGRRHRDLQESEERRRAGAFIEDLGWESASVIICMLLLTELTTHVEEMPFFARSVVVKLYFCLCCT